MAETRKVSASYREAIRNPITGNRLPARLFRPIADASRARGVPSGACERKHASKTNKNHKKNISKNEVKNMTKKPESSFVGARNLRFLNSEKFDRKNTLSPSPGNGKPGTGNLKWAHGDLNSRPTAVLEPVVLEQAI